MSNASQTSFKIAAESPYGTQASSGFYVMGITSSSVRPLTTYQQDATIRASRDIPDLVRLGIGADGEVGFALRHDPSGALYQLMESVLQSATATAVTVAVTGVTGTTVSGGIELSGGSGNVETGIEVGDVVRILDNTTFAGFFEVSAVDTVAHKITILGDGSPSFNGQTDLAVLRGKRLKNGTTQKSYTVEVGHSDMTGSDKFEVYTGMVPDRMRLTIADGQMTQGAFNFVGKRLSETRATTIDGSAALAPTTQVMNCVDHVPTFRISSTNYEATEISFEVNNASAARTVIGTLGSKSVRSGSFQVTGTLRTYLDDYTEFEKVVNDTESSLVVACRDAAGKAYAFVFPRIKYSQVEAPVTGQDTDVFVTLQWQAVYDSGANCTMKILVWD